MKNQEGGDVASLLSLLFNHSSSPKELYKQKEYQQNKVILVSNIKKQKNKKTIIARQMYKENTAELSRLIFIQATKKGSAYSFLCKKK